MNRDYNNNGYQGNREVRFRNYPGQRNNGERSGDRNRTSYQPRRGYWNNNMNTRNGRNGNNRNGRFNNNRNQRNQQKIVPKAVMTYAAPKISESKITTKFTLYGDIDAMKVKHQRYTGASDYELIKAHRQLWSMIDDNELLPNDTDSPERTPRRTRVSHENVIGVFIPELPDDMEEREIEINRRQKREKQLRKVAFRAARNVYDDESASAAFAAAMEEERESWDEEEYSRRTSGRNSEREFYCTRTLENILNRVTEEIIGEDAMIQQITYLKQTKIPAWLSSKEWIRKLNDIEKNIYWYSDQNKKIDRTTMAQDMILANIPLEWTLDFHKTRIYHEIMRNDTDNQPSNKEILAELELIEHCELKKKDIERQIKKREENRGNRNR